MADWHFAELETQMVEAEQRLRKRRAKMKAIEAAATSGAGVKAPPSPPSPRLDELERAVRDGRSKRGKLLRKLNRLEGESSAHRGAGGETESHAYVRAHSGIVLNKDPSTTCLTIGRARWRGRGPWQRVQSGTSLRSGIS